MLSGNLLIKYLHGMTSTISRESHDMMAMLYNHPDDLMGPRIFL